MTRNGIEKKYGVKVDKISIKGKACYKIQGYGRIFDTLSDVESFIVKRRMMSWRNGRE